MNTSQRVVAFIAFALAVVFAGNVNSAPAKLSGLYVNTFGNAKNQSVIFVHGGPGFNSWDFELTTAPALAREGFYVVVYDERGQGRSDETDPKNFNYKQYADDLKMIVDTLQLGNPILIGHSHGGPISLKFGQFYPEVAKSIVLVSGPVNFWGSMQSVFDTCARRYTASGQQDLLDNLTLQYYQLALNPSALMEARVEAAGATFVHGIRCGLYNVGQPTLFASGLRSLLKSNPLSDKLSGMTTAMPGFLNNEDYIHLNMVDFVVANKGRIFGIYGDEDGLFTPLEYSLIRHAIQQTDGSQNCQMILGSSHSIYIDQQSEFIRTFKRFAGR